MSAQPVQKDGAWWRRDDDGAWLKWDEGRGVWFRQPSDPGVRRGPGGPDAAPRAPDSSAAAAVPASAGAGSATAEGTPFRAVSLETAPLPAPAAGVSGRGKVLAVAALVAAAAAAAFFGLRSGAGAPSAEDVDRAFAPLTGGYTYVEPTADVLDQVEELKESNPEAAETIAEIDMREIRRGGMPLGGVVIMSFDPEYLEQKPEDNILMQQVESQYGYALSPVDLDGTPAYETTVPGASAVLFFDDDGLMILVAGLDGKAVRDIAEQLAVANR